ncbi:MAG: hypothetical protein HRU17_03550 [Polyangiaceae bacterium]|nr:hypothetical protein [Polyangiaceae bacterium]
MVSRGPQSTKLVAALVGLVAAIAPRHSAAQSLDLRGALVPVHPTGTSSTEPTETQGHLNYNVGAWFSHGYRALTLEDTNGNTVATPLEHQSTVDMVAGLGLGDSFDVSLVLPTAVYQRGDEMPAVTGKGAMPSAAIGDLSLRAKVELIGLDKLAGFSLSAIADVTAPTGSADSYLGDGETRFGSRVLGELSLLVISLRGSVGSQFRTHHEDYLGTRFGDVLPWAAGLLIRPQAFGLDDEGRWEAFLDTRGQLAMRPDFADSNASNAFWSASARYTVGDFSTLLSAELPITTSVGSPAVRGTLALGWSPRFYDVDQDGLGDEEDECPELEEDLDGFEDEDGCPDWDNDNDGVGDEEDKCPDEQEDEDDFEDEDGCLDADNDQDKIPDERDECPDEPGEAGASRLGCPIGDTDNDGVPDNQDRCPKTAEDRDGFQDNDGCVDADNDNDNIIDTLDACPDKAGPPQSDAKQNGCPNPDTDGDTWLAPDDRCPNEPEDFDGNDDSDGCPDAPSPATAWVRWTDRSLGDSQLSWKQAPSFQSANSAELSADGITILRAVVTELNRHPGHVLGVGVKARGVAPEPSQLALTRSFAIVHQLRRLAHSDTAAESLSFAAVSDLPTARRGGIGLRIMKATGSPARAQKAGTSPSEKR